MIMSARRPPGTQSGFTLVEMLVSVTILSLIMLATVSGLRTLANTQVSLASLGDRNDALRSASSFLRDALEATVVGSDTGGLSVGGGTSETTVFESGPEALIWKTTMLFGERSGGSFVVRVALEGPAVVLRWQKPDPFGRLVPWNKAPSRTLVEGVQEFAVAYRRRANGEWRSEWDSQGAPGWVRMRIRANERYWPDMVMTVTQ